MQTVISSDKRNINDPCPELKEIKSLYPGQVIQFYVYGCDNNKVAKLSAATIRVIPSDVGGVSTTYYLTDFNNPNATKVIERNPRNPKEENGFLGKFGIWPGLKSENSEYELQVWPSNNPDMPVLSRKFNFIEPYAYVKAPEQCSAIEYYPDGRTFGPQPSCKTQFAVSPMFTGEYGILSTVDPSYGKGGKENVSSISYDFDLYPEEKQVSINPSGPNGENIGSVLKFSPVSSDYNGIIEYDSTEDSTFLANYMAKNCNVTNSSVLSAASEYVLYPTQYYNYLVMKPELSEITSNFKSEAFYVPISGGKFTQNLNMSATLESTENKGIIRGFIKIFVPELRFIIDAGLVAEEIIRRSKAEYADPYITSSNDAGADNWYVCPEGSLSQDVLESTATSDLATIELM